jgi:hypothetical protein
MAWTCESVLLPPVKLCTVAAEVFSIEMNLPPDVEAEIDYRFGTAPEDAEFLYRECFLPTEGHFPLLTETLVASRADELDPELVSLALQVEFSKLRARGVLGNIVLLRESIYAFIKRKLDSGVISSPMEIV